MATYEDIKKANATIRTADIRGKEYAEVNQRVRAFRMLYPEGQIKTTMVSNDGEPGRRTCVFRAEVGYMVSGYVECDESKQVYHPLDKEVFHLLATGTAYENEGSNQINRTSYIENCETSAVGRALGFLGLGIDVSIASAEEVKQAVEQQADKPAGKAAEKITAEEGRMLVSAITNNGMSMSALFKHYGVRGERDLTREQFEDAMEIVNNWAAKNKAAKEGK